MILYYIYDIKAGFYSIIILFLHNIPLSFFGGAFSVEKSSWSLASCDWYVEPVVDSLFLLVQWLIILYIIATVAAITKPTPNPGTTMATAIIQSAG